MSIVNGVVVAIPPPEDYLVDFDNPQRRSVMAVYCVAGIGLFFATIFMLQRIYVKLVVNRSLWIDDCKLHFPTLLTSRIVMLLTISNRLCHYFVGRFHYKVSSAYHSSISFLNIIPQNLAGIGSNQK